MHSISRVMLVFLVTASTACKKEPPLSRPALAASASIASRTATGQAPSAPSPVKVVPQPAPGKGNLTGVVRFDGKPVPNINVKLCKGFSNIGFGGCTGAVYLSKTDSGGTYVLRDVPPGVYQALLVQLFDSATWVYASADILRARAYTVVAGSTAQAFSTDLYKRDLFLISPRPGVRAAGGKPELRWAAYPGAAHYLVTLDPEHPLGFPADYKKPRFSRIKVRATSFTPDKPLPPGRYRAFVAAMGTSAGNPEIAESDLRLFIVGEPAAAARPDPLSPPPLPAPPSLTPYHPPAGVGAVQGSVLYNARGAAGIEVKLCQLFERYFRGCHGKIYKTRTDARGVYLIKDIPPMVYQGLTARVFNTKLVVFMTAGFAGLSNKSYPVEAGKTLVVPPTSLFKNDVRVLSPKPKATVGQTFEVKWAPYPEARTYSLSIHVDYTAKGPRPARSSPYTGIIVDQPSFLLDLPLEPGHYDLSIIALNQWGLKIADSPSVRFAVK